MSRINARYDTVESEHVITDPSCRYYYFIFVIMIQLEKILMNISVALIWGYWLLSLILNCVYKLKIFERVEFYYLYCGRFYFVFYIL